MLITVSLICCEAGDGDLSWFGERYAIERVG